MENVINTIVVDFTNPTERSNGSILNLEYDSREAINGGLNVRSTPHLNESCYLLLSAHGAKNFDLSASSGSVVFNSGLKTREVTETVIFDGSKTGSLRLPVTKLIDYAWQGSDGGIITLKDQELSIPEEGNHVAKVTYESNYYELKLTPPNLDPETVDEYTINVIVSAEVIQ